MRQKMRRQTCHMHTYHTPIHAHTHTLIFSGKEKIQKESSAGATEKMANKKKRKQLIMNEPKA